MIIEEALSGLSMSLFYALVTLFLTGLGLVIATAILYGLIKTLTLLIRSMKGGVDDLIETAKAIITNSNTNK